MLYPKARFLALLIGGMVSSSFFCGPDSLVQYVADPTGSCPKLFSGSWARFRALSRATLHGGPLMLCALAFICLNGKS